MLYQHWITFTKQPCSFLFKVVYAGDYATYERVKQAASVMANEGEYFKFIPTFADFHLQMRWAKVCCITMLYKSVCVLASLTDI